jgi:predicted ABC-type transport system involved in lysophospholipase L1 biosynthesis ATPase subunit
LDLGVDCLDDPKEVAPGGTHILELLLEFQRARHATIVMVTHDLGIAAELDRTIAMRDGRLA